MNSTVRLRGRVGGALAGREVLTFAHSIVADGSHIDPPTSCARWCWTAKDPPAQLVDLATGWLVEDR